MKFTEILAHLAVGLREPVADFTELLRAVREGCEEITAKRIELLRARGEDIDENDLISEWDAGHLKTLFRGKPGPGGGVALTAQALGFYLIAYLADCPRREVAAKALDMTFATYMPPHDRRDKTECPVTGQRFFGGALKTLLTDRDVFDRAVLIRVSSDAGFAKIGFERGVESMFWRTGPVGLGKPAYRERVLLLDGVRFLFDLVNEAESAETSKLSTTA